MTIHVCACCGLAQRVPEVPAGHRARCGRCRHGLVKRSILLRSRHRTIAFALAGLVLYPPAVGLPIMQIERFGYVNEASILGGVSALWGGGHVILGLVVLLCSVVFPLGKLVALLVLSSRRVVLADHHRAWTYRLVEATGRWGMLDVLLVAILVAALKLGDIVSVNPGPAALAFVAVVAASLLAAAVFDPHAFWSTRDVSSGTES